MVQPRAMKFQNSPVRLNSFQEMGLAPVLLAALQKMGITKPTLIQGQAIPISLQGADLIAIAQTGSGKTLAFALSLLTKLLQNCEARALVLANTKDSF